MNFIAFVTVAGGEGTQLEGPAMVDVEKEEVTKQFAAWEPEALNLLDVSRTFRFRSHLWCERTFELTDEKITGSVLRNRLDGRSAIFVGFRRISTGALHS